MVELCLDEIVFACIFVLPENTKYKNRKKEKSVELCLDEIVFVWDICAS